MSLQLARPDLLSFVPYSSARQEASAAGVLLNANEWPWAPFAGGEGLNRYPQPQPAELVNRLADIYAVDPDMLLVGRGSDEAIDLLVRGFCRPGIDAVVTSPPTFGMYRVSAQLQGAAAVEVPLLAARGFAVDADALIAAAHSANAKLVFVCTPNNPTGQLADRADVLRVVDALRDQALVVVDEAYVEFADAPSYTEAMHERPNLLVLRTLSKAFGLAAARIGTLVGEPSIIAFVRGLIAPYPIPQPSLVAALAGLDPVNDELRAQRLAQTRAERVRMAKEFEQSPWVSKVWRSDANFLCIQMPDSQRVLAALAASKVIVRSLARYPGLADCLRISVGTREENSAALAALQTINATTQDTAA